MAEPLHPYQHAEFANDTVETPDGDYSLDLVTDPFDLPAGRAMTQCPACGTTAEGWMRMEYHAAGQLDGPCGEKYGWPLVAKIPEHVCVRCIKCKWGEPQRMRHAA